MEGGESGVICCKLRAVGKVEHIFQFFLTEGDFSMGESWLVVYITHHQGLIIILGGCGDYPEFFLLGIQIWPACRFYYTGGLSACIGIY